MVSESQADREVAIDVPSLIGKSKSEIDRIWGRPNCPPRNACDYGQGREVFYVDERAANLTLPPVDDLHKYRLNIGAPTFENVEVGIKRWKMSIHGVDAEVSQFADYVYVKTREP